MITELKQRDILRTIETEGRETYVLAAPVLITLTAALMADLKRAYPLSEETGGILFAYPDANARTLTIKRWVQLPNRLPVAERKTAYSTSTALLNKAIADCVSDQALPIFFHSHPVTGTGTAYDSKRLNFYDRTSQADRHNSYLPISINGLNVVMPQGLLVANDREGNDVDLSLYSGFIAPMSLRALRDAEKYYLYFAGLLLLLLFSLGKTGRNAALLALAGAAVIFYTEERKRPRYSRDDTGNHLILLP